METYIHPVSDLQTERIVSLLSYEAETGKFYWKETRGNRKKGSEAGSIDGHGYVRIQVNRIPHRAHNIAWLFISGEWPKLSIDHINRDRSDNRAFNLRQISFSNTLLNSPTSKSGKIDSYQIGGDHYTKYAYQHWNMVADIDLHYFLACATKYISRWRDKNGIEDLRKAAQYIAKSDQELIFADHSPENTSYFKLYINQFGSIEREIMRLIYISKYPKAINLISELIEEELCESSANYIDPDNNYYKG